MDKLHNTAYLTEEVLSPIVWYTVEVGRDSKFTRVSEKTVSVKVKITNKRIVG